MTLPRLMGAGLAVLLLAACSSGSGAEADPAPTATSSAAATDPAPPAQPTGTSPAPTTPVPAASAPPSQPAEPSAAAPTPATTRRPAAAPSSDRVVLTAAGVEVDGRDVPFGTPFTELAGLLEEALGAPTRDTGVGPSFSEYGTCPGSVLRALEYADGAAVFLFGDVGGPGNRWYAWNLRADGTPQQAPAVRADAGGADELTVRIGTTVEELRSGASDEFLRIAEGDEVFGPSFNITDPAGELPGQVSDTSPAGTGTVTFVNAGQGCGE